MTSPRVVWSESAEVAKRRQQPEQYWCVALKRMTEDDA